MLSQDPAYIEMAQIEIAQTYQNKLWSNQLRRTRMLRPHSTKHSVHGQQNTRRPQHNHYNVPHSTKRNDLQRPGRWLNNQLILQYTSPDSPIYGTRQGSGNSPIIWLFISNFLLKLLLLDTNRSNI